MELARDQAGAGAGARLEKKWKIDLARALSNPLALPSRSLPNLPSAHPPIPIPLPSPSISHTAPSHSARPLAQPGLRRGGGGGTRPPNGHTQRAHLRFRAAADPCPTPADTMGGNCGAFAIPRLPIPAGGSAPLRARASAALRVASLCFGLSLGCYPIAAWR
jgi:hypothetical protein